MADPRIDRIQRGIAWWDHTAQNAGATQIAVNTLADLRAWQEIAERHGHCRNGYMPCHDLETADAALDRLDALWGQS